GTALWLLGIPLALSLGIFGGLSEFIPYVGPIVAAVPALLVAFMLGPIHALEVLGLYLIVHLFEGELLVPMIQRWTVSLPPALGIIAVVLFGWLFGLPGILFATPLTVVLIELIRTLYVQTALKAN
ncbi:MAG TPA: AI-2E family transporter, partial [Steroidobacteraceae bacterium]|nr:AI-2E family transporter [Steroidobacteraceae bacterium]